MRIVHFVQPRRAPRPNWSGSDQRCDAPLAAIKQLSESDRETSHSTIVFGGEHAVLDARQFGFTMTSHAPICGDSRFGLQRLLSLPRTLSTPDVLIGWGSQFGPIFDRIAPRSNAICIDLATGVPNVRSLMQSAWHKLSPLPARLAARLAARPTDDLPSRTNVARSAREPHRVRIGLCGDGICPEPMSAFIFAIGCVAVSGFEVDAVVHRESNGVRRLQRHTVEGGRINSIRIVDRPLPLTSSCADLWIWTLTPKSGAPAASHFDWASMLAADCLTAQGATVLAAVPSSVNIHPGIAPRGFTAKTDSLSEVSGRIRQWLLGSEFDQQRISPSDLCSSVLRIARGISAQEPILNLEVRDPADA